MYNSDFFDTGKGRNFVSELQESLRKITEELRRANDLKERELQALENAQSKSPENNNVLKVRTVSVEVIDVLEDWLDKKGLKIPDENRTGDESEACLYGNVYSDFEDWVTGKLTGFFQGIIDEGYATDEAKVMADAIFGEFFVTILVPFFPKTSLTLEALNSMTDDMKKIINAYAIKIIDDKIIGLNTVEL